MRKVLVAIVCLGLFATVANANDLLLYFSYQADNSMVPAEFEGAVNPTYTGAPIYLWAFLGDTDEWNGVALDLTANNAEGVSIQYNPTHAAGQRWNNNSDLDFVGDNHTFAVAVTEFGLGSALEQILLPEWSIGRHYMVGELDLGAGDFVEEFLAVGTGGIARRGGNPNDDGIYIGFDEAGAWDGPVRGDDIGATTAVADIVPEPVSLLLLGLAGLALRRR